VPPLSGIIFSVLLITGLLLFRLSVRAKPLDTGAWLKNSSNKVALALNLVPFAGIAFLWFIEVGVNRMTLTAWLRARDRPQRCILARLGGFLRRVGYL
jgi:hypothetical protein